MSERRYIQYGCGMSAPEGWRNFDASPTLRFERLPILGHIYTKNEARFPKGVEYGDIVKGLPTPDNSCDGIYCSHVLEHLSLDGFRTALRNTYKALRRGGTFRLVLPDLEHSIKKYLSNDSNEAAMEFMRETSLGHERRAIGLLGLVSSWVGNSQHLWMWDYKSMGLELRNAGFVNIRRANFGDSSDPVFSEVEDRTRWDDCLGIECQKPE